MSSPRQCAVCDAAIDAYGRAGTRCARCAQPCPVCNGDIACCGHPLPSLVDVTVDTDPHTGNLRIAA